MRCFRAVKTGSASDKAYITLFFTVAHSLEVCKDNAIRISGTKPKGLLAFSVFPRRRILVRQLSKHGILFMCRLLYNSQKFL